MVQLVVFINLFFIPLLPLYLIYRAKQKPLEPSLDLLFQYAMIAVCNIPLTKVFIFLAKTTAGIFISIDSGYYTLAALIPTLFAVLLNKIYTSTLQRKPKEAEGDIPLAYIRERNLRSEKNIAHSVISGLAAHPYLWTLGICLFLQPFFLGAEENIPNNALWLETFMVIGAAAAFGVYMYKSGKFGKSGLIVFGITVIVADCFAVKLYSQSQNKAMWHFVGGCVVVTIIAFIFYHCADFKKYQRQINSLMIMGLGFCLKLHYILITSVDIRQHDTLSFGDAAGHAGYIEYLLFNHALPGFDVRERWSFYHPPLHHAISAAWIYINENILLTGHDPARESLQTLTLFYSMCIVISAYRILRHFRLEGRALYIPLIIISFHPSFTLFAGSINNDVLSVAFMVGAVLSTLKWYEDQTMKGIMKIALCVGLGMMTKISAAIIAPAIALVFLTVFIKKIRTDGKKLMSQFVCFGLVSVPLGMWFGIRNYIKWGVPFTYVTKLDESSLQYVGYQSFFSRVTDFSLTQFASVYVQVGNNEQGYYEYNPLITLMKSSLFGVWTFISESNVGAVLPIILFWINVAIAGFAFVAMITLCLKKSLMQRTETLFLGGLYTVIMVSFYKMAADYPHTCTMDFRYITPTAIIGAVFTGLLLQRMNDQNKSFGRVVVFALDIGAFLFAVCSGLVYLICVK